MKHLKYYIMAVAVLVLTVTGCDKGPDGYEVDGSGTVIEALGPNPVLRGADMNIVGQHVDRVTSVIFPSGIEIGSSDFKDVTSGSFKVTVPMDAVPGYVKVVYKGGSYESKTAISYTEPFEVTSISPTDKALVMGDEVTVKGEYLNNITSIGFVNGVVVDSTDFISQSRYEIVFPIARGAVSGKIYVADVNGNQAYSDEDLTITQPSIVSVSPTTVRPGDVVTITGTLLDQIDKVTFSGASAITVSDFTSVTKTTIKVTVPSDIHDGPVSITTAAAAVLESSEDMTVKVPSGLAITPETRYKAGLNVVISGTDLDLVTGVDFGSVSSDFTYSDSKIKAVIPETATDGKLTLSTAAGKSVDTQEITLAKPVISSFSPSSVVAGDKFDLIGEDLDLVKSATLDGVDIPFETVSASKLTLTTSAVHATGKVALKCANGVTVTSDNDMTITYNSIVIVNSLTSSASVGDYVTMTGSKFNMIESIYFGTVKVTDYSKREDNEMIFKIPDSVEGGTYNIKFVLTTGDEETCPSSIDVKGAVTTVNIFSGSTDLGTGWSTVVNLAWQNLFNDMPQGSQLYVEYETTNDDSYSQVKLMRGSDWAVLTSVTDVNAWGCIDVAKGSTKVTYALNTQDVNDLVAAGLVVSGYSVKITKVYYTYPNTSK